MDTHHRIRDVFDAAIQLPKERRAAFVHEQAGREPRVYDELVRLIRAYEDSVETAGATPGTGEHAIPRMIGYGAYEVVRELGRGGMGAVYLARRVDGTFDRDVAVKIVRGDRLAPTALERFSRERRMLARLRHPGIAALYDAGSTDDGLPYFVMEYVDGLPLTESCDRKRLDVHARVRLFARICEAVACAHRVPMVHCDLKPANIIVDADGEPRILDFGIATALTPGGQEEEAPLDPYGSPGYASPEQLRGEPLQTTSDIYSLGVVLHELLVGRPPSRTPSRAMQADPRTAAPSAMLEAGDLTGPRLDNPTEVAALRSTNVAGLHETLHGDLDAIVGKCLQVPPELRYPTVESLHDDLQRWLTRRPVAARDGGPLYVASRFASRHRGLVAAAAAMIVLIAAATIGMIYQWRTAERERRLAEQRFADVRALATSLFDVDASLAPLAGTMAARQLIVDNAIRYLDRLGRDSAADPDLSREIAESYRRLGDMLGNPNASNLGRRTQALEQYQNGGRHLAAALALRPNDPRVALAGARLAASRADVLLAQGSSAEALETYQQSAATLQGLLQQDGESVELRRALSGVYRPLGDLALASGDPTAALTMFVKARAIDLALQAQEPDAAEPRRLLALTQLRVAEALLASGRRADAIAAYDETAKLLQALVVREPANARLVRDLAVGRMKLARATETEDRGRARAELERAVAVFNELARADPLNGGARRDLLVALMALGDLDAPGDPAGARASYMAAQREAEALAAEPFIDPQAERDLSLVRERLREHAAPELPAELKLTLLRDGAEVLLDKHARPPALGEQLRVSWTPAPGRIDYVLTMGGQGRARLLSRADLAANSWHVVANGPLPSQTLLLLSSPGPLDASQREALIDRVSRVPEPRDIPPDAHILWRNRREVLDTTASARGGDATAWTAVVRKELEQVPGLVFSGRTFPLAPR